jgi:hypothetical protein
MDDEIIEKKEPKVGLITCGFLLLSCLIGFGAHFPFDVNLYLSISIASGLFIISLFFIALWVRTLEPRVERDDQGI